ncbi:hypothetical protein [Marinobacter metalliresistant]|uniref:Uncharacterized protein n=1 Tax=Marinobacter metalliresistant TaxID=2961995 RepID=A0ABZ2VYW7_9GAMM
MESPAESYGLENIVLHHSFKKFAGLDAPFGSSAESGHMLAVPTELEKPPSCI